MICGVKLFHAVVDGVSTANEIATNATAVINLKLVVKKDFGDRMSSNTTQKGSITTSAWFSSLFRRIPKDHCHDALE